MKACLCASLLLLLAAGEAKADTTIERYFAGWFDRVAQAQDSQPHWMTPLLTITPRLEEEFRYDQYWEHTPGGVNLSIAGGGKGLELIPTASNEILINLPPFRERGGQNPASGFGDWPVLTFKQRLLSGNENNGDEIVTAFLGVQAPFGNRAFTNHSWLVTPTVAMGKGWGDFDIQATIGASIATAHADAIGTAIVSNLAFQYQWDDYFWPEIEFNDTAWSGGPRDGLNQLFLTAGIIFGRFQLSGRRKLILGGGYQFALSPDPRLLPPTPVYDRNWLVSARLAF